MHYLLVSAHIVSAYALIVPTMAPFSSTMIATVAISALKYAAAFQPASPTFVRRAMSSGPRMSSTLSAADNDFEDFTSKVSPLDLMWRK